MASQREQTIIAVLIGLLVISGSVAAYYFTQYTQQVALNQEAARQAEQLNAKYGQAAASLNSIYSKYNETVTRYNSAVASYNGSVASFKLLTSSYLSAANQFEELAANYRSVLDDYNSSLSLLATTVSLMNTTEPAFKEASAALSRLSSSYDTLASKYAQTLTIYDGILTGFRAIVKDFQESHNVSFVVQYPEAVPKVPTSALTVNVLIEPGNGTSRWYNGTSIHPGWNLYIVTVVVAQGDIQATWYPQYGAHFITSLVGLPITSSMSWFLWTYDPVKGWKISDVGADFTPALNGGTYAWTFCTFDSSYRPLCKP